MKHTIALVLGVLSLGATCLSPSAPCFAATGPTSATTLSWNPCAQPDGPADQQCADLSVPVDYGKPDGAHLTLRVTRLVSDRPAARRGTLLVVPGGPGGSGVDTLAHTGPAMREALHGAYDLVSLDPRGVGGSTAVGCGLSADDRDVMNLRSWPGPGGDITDSVARAHRIADVCARNGGAVVRSYSTANEVRDIERLRQALAAAKVSMYGVSYGTYVTAAYAQEHPEHTDRVVLDSTGDPDPARVERGWLANTAAGADERFPDFARWAAEPARDRNGLRLAQHASGVEPLVLSLADRLDRAPRATTTPHKPLTGDILRQAVQQALYSDGGFPALAQLIKTAEDPHATLALPPGYATPMPDRDAAVFTATQCNDVSWPRDVHGYARAVATDRIRHPLTAGQPVNLTPCAFWHTEPAETPVHITSDGPSNILMLQNLRDPVTPYFGALRMRTALGDRARLVTVDQGGHGAYHADGTTCGDRAVTGYLLTGHRPSADLRCPSDDFGADPLIRHHVEHDHTGSPADDVG
ncbi:TAP-like protein [Actinacidiphila yanglinensis]|uniref:TAP-like protein n=1 Tax=Actinacidiphila yanglinensis TaxID=310779 RepID=A0A1H6DGE5_9ACTN|nr:alpha/beta hydrolase [Actinacidiphila yanglinensis]SEG84192.1 TAP-like protein [Actinacidiphila yanglinensis]